ncbi:hypothetical protein ABIE65_001695 [Constrictibacter sp. MBR-5]|jgi:hypothetical protein|uniref:hypothetical protein n=1 Tax=Constrictibacter sp. MBR-5 TaxID=3156467 RepID=UPI0033936D63
MADDIEALRSEIPALRRAQANDTAILKTRRAELVELRAILPNLTGTTGPLQEREIYLVASIKRLEAQIVDIGRAIELIGEQAS